MRKWKAATIGCYGVLGRCQCQMKEWLHNFAFLTDDMQSRSPASTDLACKNRETAQLIYRMWTARFG